MALTRRTFVKAGAIGAAGVIAASCVSWEVVTNNNATNEAVFSSHSAFGADLDYGDVLLGVFTNSENDSTDTFYMSVDGIHFEKISDAFVNLYPNDPNNDEAVGSYEDGRTWPLYSFKCPSLIWHNGYFWMLANESNSGDDGTLRLVVSNSKDLVHWCDQRQVKVAVPSGFVENGTAGQFDAVAADWSVGSDGNIYVAVSIGRYGAFHGDPEQDTMYPYLVKITDLFATNDPAVNPLLNDSNYITVTAQTAQQINLPNASTNRIDGSWYFENGSAYLSIKVNGVTNEIWSITDLGRVSDSGAWTLVNGNVITGYEAPCLTKKNSVYYMYTDQLATYTPDANVRAPYYSTGTFIQMSTGLSSGWTSEQFINAYNKDYQSLASNAHNNEYGDGPRHGTVILVTDEEAKKVIWDQRNACGWTFSPIRFSDVANPNEYYFESVSYMADLGLITGYGPYYTTFGVGDSMMRKDFVTVLWRYCKPDEYATYDENNAKNETGLPDVPDGAYYTGAINWAVREEIITGYQLNDGSYAFEPNNEISFEQMIVVIARYVLGGIEAAAQYDTSSLDNGPFTDANAVEDFARGAMAWAIDHGVVTGNQLDNGLYRLDPLESVARERAATVLARSIQNGLVTVE